MNKKIKDYISLALKAKQDSEEKHTEIPCPHNDLLAEFVQDISTGNQPDESVREHIYGCDACFSKAANCLFSLAEREADIPHEKIELGIKKAKKIPRQHSSKGVKNMLNRNKYLLISSVFFISSFLFKTYFLQFLLAALIFGLKWIMDTGGSKALIMIYNTLYKTNKGKDDSDKKMFFDRRI
jgi:hypothetical protein